MVCSPLAKIRTTCCSCSLAGLPDPTQTLTALSTWGPSQLLSLTTLTCNSYDTWVHVRPHGDHFTQTHPIITTLRRTGNRH